MNDMIDEVLRTVLVQLNGISVRGVEDTRAMAWCLQALIELRKDIANGNDVQGEVEKDA